MTIHVVLVFSCLILFSMYVLGQPTTDSTKIVIELNEIMAQELPPIGKMTLAEFIETYNDSSLSGQKVEEYLFQDLDSNGTPELLITTWTGGQHCCRQLLLLKKVGVDSFLSVATFANRQVAVNFLGEIDEWVAPDYYYTGHTRLPHYDNPMDPWARYRYHKDQVFMAPVERLIDSTTFTDKLQELSESPIPADECSASLLSDNGERAGYANVLLAYFYLTYDRPTTMRWFEKYYVRCDKKTIRGELESMMELHYPIMN